MQAWPLDSYWYGYGGEASTQDHAQVGKSVPVINPAPRPHMKWKAMDDSIYETEFRHRGCNEEISRLDARVKEFEGHVDELSAQLTRKCEQIADLTAEREKDKALIMEFVEYGDIMCEEFAGRACTNTQVWALQELRARVARAKKAGYGDIDP